MSMRGPPLKAGLARRRRPRASRGPASACRRAGGLVLGAFPSAGRCLHRQATLRHRLGDPDLERGDPDRRPYTPTGSTPTTTSNTDPAPPTGPVFRRPKGIAGAAEYPNTVQAQQAISGLSRRPPTTTGSSPPTRSERRCPDDQTFTTPAPRRRVTDEAATEVAGGFRTEGHRQPQRVRHDLSVRIRDDGQLRVEHPGRRSERRLGLQRSGRLADGLLVCCQTPTYHFRLVAHGPGTRAATADRTFTTASAALGADRRGRSPAAKSPEASPQRPGQSGQPGNHLSLRVRDLDRLRDEHPLDRRQHRPRLERRPGEPGSHPGLQPNTTYHYRIVANNSDGPGDSGDEDIQYAAPEAGRRPRCRSPKAPKVSR